MFESGLHRVLQDVQEEHRPGCYLDNAIARLRPFLPEAIPGLDISRMELAPGGQLSGIPHTPGTCEYLTCERGRLALLASGERWAVTPGDTLVFRGDQRHTYRNLDARRAAVAVTVVCFAPVSA